MINVAGGRKWTAKALHVFVVALLMFAMTLTSIILSAALGGGDADGGGNMEMRHHDSEVYQVYQVTARLFWGGMSRENRKRGGQRTPF